MTWHWRFILSWKYEVSRLKIFKLLKWNEFWMYGDTDKMITTGHPPCGRMLIGSWYLITIGHLPCCSTLIGSGYLITIGHLPCCSTLIGSGYLITIGHLPCCSTLIGSGYLITIGHLPCGSMLIGSGYLEVSSVLDALRGLWCRPSSYCQGRPAFRHNCQDNIQCIF